MLIFQVFLVLWWLLPVLLIIGTCQFIFRLFEICCAGLRFCKLKMKMGGRFNQMSRIDQVTIKNYISNRSRGNWFVLYQLSKNMNEVVFVDFLITLANTVEPIQGYWNIFGNEGDEDYVALKMD